MVKRVECRVVKTVSLGPKPTERQSVNEKPILAADTENIDISGPTGKFSVYGRYSAINAGLLMDIAV